MEGATTLATAIRGWLEATSEARPALGPDVPDAFNLGVTLIRRFEKGTRSLSMDASLPDGLNAVCLLLGNQASQPGHFSTVTNAYTSVQRLDWGQDLFDERSQLLGRLAFLAWDCCRRFRSYAEMRVWQARCAEHVLAQEIVRQYVEVPAAQRSNQLNGRFLSDPAVLLTQITKLWDEANTCPRRVLDQAMGLFKWISVASGRRALPDEVRFLFCEVVLLIGGTHRLMGNLGQASLWLDRLELASAKVTRSEFLFAKRDLQRLTILAERFSLKELLTALSGVRKKCFQLGMAQEVRRCTFIEGIALKGLSRESEAIAIFNRIIKSSKSEDGIKGFALSSLANIYTFRNEPVKAFALYREALPLIQKAGWVAGLADLKTGLAETLRVIGRPGEAIEAYKEAVGDLDRAGFIGRSAYIRILYAEVLLQIGRYSEACFEILQALPVISDQRSLSEGIVAVGLLRESIRRGHPDEEALRAIKAHLQGQEKRGEGYETNSTDS